MLGGIDEPPGSRGYKFGGLALQVGCWVTGRKPITIKELTVRKHKLWPQKSHTEWNWPPSSSSYEVLQPM